MVAHDKKGNLISDLKREDFTVFEDGKKQQVSTFDFENVDELALAGKVRPDGDGNGASAPALRANLRPDSRCWMRATGG